MSTRDGVDKHQFAASMSDHQRLLKLGAAGPCIGTTKGLSQECCSFEGIRGGTSWATSPTGLNA